jgi:exopolysaccharide biosynthesis WecB/TagA/CpsF family protein
MVASGSLRVMCSRTKNPQKVSFSGLNTEGQIRNMSNESNAVVLQQTEILRDQECGQVPPLFVVGVWRSGTTLLYALLNQHPDIRLFYESDIAVLWPMFRLPWGRKAWAEKWEYWNAGVSRHDLDPLRLASPTKSMAEAIEMAGREYCEKKGGKIWGCKSPSYYDRLVPLAREFPGARFIVIWRDPEEICRSVVSAASSGAWFARGGMTHRGLMASETLKQQCDELLKMGSVSLHQIHYRDLVNDPTNTMRGICEFLEIPFTPAVTVLEGADRSAVFEGAHHALARGNSIVARREPKGVLPPVLLEKIRRYKALWKAESGDWLLCKHFHDVGETKPSTWERVTDQLSFRALRLIDLAPRLLYSILPTWVWRGYRSIKYRDAQYLHRQLTKKSATSSSNSNSCAVRLGKLWLHSMPVDELLSTNGNELKHIATVHSEMFVYAHQNPALGSILQHTVNTIDGRILHFTCSFLYPGRKLQKISGSDLIYDFAEYATKHGERVFLLGAEEPSNRGAIETLKARYPGLMIDGYSPPLCSNIQDEEWNESILSRIASFRPTHLVVCFGPLKQEMWISQNADRLLQLGVGCAIGLGGTLDFVSGRKKRAPKWIQGVGAEWLFRVFTESGRLGRTAKMFLMPYFASKFYNREARSLTERGTSTISTAPAEAAGVGVRKSSIRTEVMTKIETVQPPPIGSAGNGSGKYVTISVDDGHTTDLRTLDLLLEHNLKATFYIPSANAERPVMHPDQIREIDRHCEVGSHTLNHVRLTRLPADSAWREIYDGKRSLEDTLGHEVVSFCYPGGKFNRRIAGQVAKAGFLAARTCMFFLNDFPDDPFRWGVSTYANTYPAHVQFRHGLLEFNIQGSYNYLTKFGSRTRWAEQFLCALDQVSRKGGIAHLYLHSWEIDQNNEWDELKTVLNAVSQHSLTSVTNGDLYRSWYEKRGMVPAR